MSRDNHRSSPASSLGASKRSNVHTTNEGLEVVLRLDAEQVETIAQRVASLLPAPSVPPAWLDAAGAAEHLATSKDRIYDLVGLGKLSPRRDGRRLLFKREDLDAYVESAA